MRAMRYGPRGSKVTLAADNTRARELQKSELAPPPPESPPPNLTWGLAGCGLGVMMSGDTTPIAVIPVFSQDLSFAERRRAVKPWRISAGPPASPRREKER